MMLIGAAIAWTGSRFFLPAEDVIRILLDDKDVGTSSWFVAAERVLGWRQQWWRAADVEILIPDSVRRPDVLRALFSVKWFSKLVNVLHQRLSSSETVDVEEKWPSKRSPSVQEVMQRTLRVGKELCGISSSMEALLQRSCAREFGRLQPDGLHRSVRRKRVRTAEAEDEGSLPKRPCYRPKDAVFAIPPTKPSAANLTRVVTGESELSQRVELPSSENSSPSWLDSASSGSDVTVLAPPLLSLDPESV